MSSTTPRKGAVVPLGDVAEMRRDHDVVHLAERMVERQRLDVVDVEAGAGDRFGVQRRDQRLLVDDRPARGVDEIGGRLHQPELSRADEPARAVAQHDMNGDDVGIAEQIVLGDVVDARFLRLFRRQVLAPGDRPSCQGLGDRRDALAELAQAERCRASGLRGRGPCVDLPGRAGFSRAFSKPMWRVNSSIRPKAMPAVGLPKPPVPQTGMPRSVAALTSNEVLRAPVVISSFRSGRASITLRGKRRALAHADDDGKALQRLDRLVRAGEGLIEDLDLDVLGDRRPVGEFHRHVLVVVENGCPTMRNSVDAGRIRAVRL